MICPLARALGRTQPLLLESTSGLQLPRDMLEMSNFLVVRGMSQVLKSHWKILKAILPAQLQPRRVAVSPCLSRLQGRSLGSLRNAIVGAVSLLSGTMAEQATGHLSSLMCLATPRGQASLLMPLPYLLSSYTPNPRSRKAFGQCGHRSQPASRQLLE